MGAVAVGATIYFGSEQSRRQIIEISQAFEYAHELGMATILWCYLRNNDFKKDGTDYHAAADLTGQANHIGVTIKADSQLFTLVKRMKECILNSQLHILSTFAVTRLLMAIWGVSV